MTGRLASPVPQDAYPGRYLRDLLPVLYSAGAEDLGHWAVEEVDFPVPTDEPGQAVVNILVHSWVVGPIQALDSAK